MNTPLVNYFTKISHPTLSLSLFNKHIFQEFVYHSIVYKQSVREIFETKMHELNENLGYYPTRTYIHTDTYVKYGTTGYARHVATKG